MKKQRSAAEGKANGCRLRPRPMRMPLGAWASRPRPAEKTCIRALFKPQR